MAPRWSGFRAPIRRGRDGSYVVDLDPAHREAIGSLLDQLRELLSTDSDALRRLFPPPYGDDDERNAGYAALAGSELVERRLAAIELVESTLDATSLDEEQLMVWMRAINDLRLVIGTLLDVDEGDLVVPEDSDDAAMYATYEFLGGVLELIVCVLDR